ncbi:MAG: hypothetical protein AAGI90_07190, partial [Chlamydiota bacterium]
KIESRLEFLKTNNNEAHMNEPSTISPQDVAARFQNFFSESNKFMEDDRYPKPYSTACKKYLDSIPKYLNQLQKAIKDHEEVVCTIKEIQEDAFKVYRSTKGNYQEGLTGYTESSIRLVKALTAVELEAAKSQDRVEGLESFLEATKETTEFQTLFARTQPGEKKTSSAKETERKVSS